MSRICMPVQLIVVLHEHHTHPQTHTDKFKSGFMQIAAENRANVKVEYDGNMRLVYWNGLVRVVSIAFDL